MAAVRRRPLRMRTVIIATVLAAMGITATIWLSGYDELLRNAGIRKADRIRGVTNPEVIRSQQEYFQASQLQDPFQPRQPNFSTRVTTQVVDRKSKDPLDKSIVRIVDPIGPTVVHDGMTDSQGLYSFEVSTFDPPVELDDVVFRGWLEVSRTDYVPLKASLRKYVAERYSLKTQLANPPRPLVLELERCEPREPAVRHIGFTGGYWVRDTYRDLRLELYADDTFVYFDMPATSVQSSSTSASSKSSMATCACSTPIRARMPPRGPGRTSAPNTWSRLSATIEARVKSRMYCPATRSLASDAGAPGAAIQTKNAISLLTSQGSCA